MHAAATPNDTPPEDSGEFFDALRKGALIGAAILVLLLPPLRMAQQHLQQRASAPMARTAPPPGPQQQQPAPPVAAAPQPQPKAAPAPLPPRLADFGNRQPSPDVKLVANWVAYTHDNGHRAFAVVDKKFARVWLFDPDGHLRIDVPALLGEAVGDTSAPGIGNKPLSLIKPWEKTTPAGRYVAELGLNNHREDVVWVDYEAAISMHRIRKVKESEHRFARLASPTYKDNRISNGCINLPVSFYEKHLKPAVQGTGVVIYVLPEVRSIQQVFGAWNVTSPLTLAEVAQRKG